MTRLQLIQFVFLVTLAFSRPASALDLLPIGDNRLMVTIVESAAPARYDQGAVVAIDVLGPSGMPTELNYRAVVLGTEAELVFLELLPGEAMDLIRRRESQTIALRQIARPTSDWLVQRRTQDSEKSRIVLAPNFMTFEVTVSLSDEDVSGFWPGSEVAADLDTADADSADARAYVVSAEKLPDGRHKVTLAAARFYAAQIIKADKNGRLGLARPDHGRRKEGRCYVRSRSGQSVRDIEIPCSN